jgi:hypothetical protein
MVLAALATLAAGSTEAGAAGAEPTAAPPAAAHLQRANELLAHDELAAACGELEAAYGSSRDPMLWLRIGRLRLRLHEDAAARAAMQRFLDESVNPHPALRAEAQRALRELMNAPPPPPAPPPPAGDSASLTLYHDLRLVPVTIVTRRDRRLMKIGATLLAAGYLPALAVSIGLAPSIGQPNAPSAAANYTLLVPVLGPFLSAVVAPTGASSGDPRPLISSWSVPWALTSGLVQAAGFAALVAGALPRRVPVLASLPLHIAPYAAPGGGGLWAAAAF